MTGGELRRKRIAYDEKVDVVLTEKDRSLILEETFVETSTVRLLNLAIARGANLVVRMTMGDLDDLLATLRQRRIMRRPAGCRINWRTSISA
jgi:hypothetical protein